MSTDKSTELVGRLIDTRDAYIKTIVAQIKKSIDVGRSMEDIPDGLAEEANKHLLIWDEKIIRSRIIEHISAFQTVHVLSFINSKKYVDDIGDFTRLVCSYLFEGNHDNCIYYSDMYTNRKTKKIYEQIFNLCEDISCEATNPSIMLLSYVSSQLLFRPSYVFYLYSLFIAADVFKDEEMKRLLLIDIEKAKNISI